MNINSISSFFPSVLQTASTIAGGTGSANAASSVQPDSASLSPATSFLNELQQLEQQNPTQFQQLISQITSQLEQGASAATSSGNATQATELSNLATAFQNAENGGALPTAQQLLEAGLTGHHHHHGHHGVGQAGLDSLLQSSNADDAQTLASSIFGSITAAGSNSGASSVFTPPTNPATL